MIDNSLILKEIAQLRDIVNLGVCVGVYQTCNGKQFKHMPASDFVNFLNLKLDKAKVHPLPRQKQRICYMLFAVSHTIALSDFPKHWIESMLELCWNYVIFLWNITTSIIKISLVLEFRKRTKNTKK